VIAAGRFIESADEITFSAPCSGHARCSIAIEAASATRNAMLFYVKRSSLRQIRLAMDRERESILDPSAATNATLIGSE